MIRKLYKPIGVLLVALVFSNCAIASTSNDIKLDQSAFEQWIHSTAQEAEEAGVSQTTINNTLKKASLVPTVIKLDRRQPYKTKSFADYTKTVLPQSRVKKAKTLYRENKALLDRIGKQYGVQPRFIVTLWGIESNFGQNMGSFSIIDALATLAFEGRRASFFKKELINAMKIIDQGHAQYDNMKGSWAGAMGQTQFMPSSFLSLAVDGNSDGKKDIWATKEDVFASIANYLSQSKWDNTTTWGRRVSLPKQFDKKLIDIKLEKTLAEWQNLGVRTIDGKDLPKRELTASLITPEENGKEVFLVYSNYKTVLKWNRSLYFATAVGLLSDKIGNL